MGKFKKGDRVRGVGTHIGSERKYKVGMLGTVIDDTDSYDIVSVEFDDDIGGHSCGGLGKEGHCWNCNSIEGDDWEVVLVREPKEEPKESPKPTEVIIDESHLEDAYENACWFCRKGGLVDLYLNGRPGICPKCGRVMGVKGVKSVKAPDKPNTPVTPTPPDNRPLTTEELKALPEGSRVFTVWCDLGRGKPTWDKPYTTWRTKKDERLNWSNGTCYISENGAWFKAYLTEQHKP